MVSNMSIVKRIWQTYNAQGLSGVFYLFKDKVIPYRVKPINNIDLYLKYFAGKKGIEIGGPSGIFCNEIPVYPAIEVLDGCNFSNQTVWEGTINEGNNYNYYKNKKGYQYICEASELTLILDEKYDFLVASHCLEHCANPILTIKEWLRVVKKGGAILLVLPDRKYTFDHNRPVTTFNHLLSDMENKVDEKDLTHLPEILELHDLNMDQAAGTIEDFKNRSLNNYKNRCLHHHVFDFKLLEKIYLHFNIKVINCTFVRPYHQVILGIKQ